MFGFGKPRKLSDHEVPGLHCSLCNKSITKQNPIVKTGKLWVYHYFRFPWNLFLRQSYVQLKLCAGCAEMGLAHLHQRKWDDQHGEFLHKHQDLYAVKVADLVPELPPHATVAQLLWAAVVGVKRSRINLLGDQLNELDAQENKIAQLLEERNRQKQEFERQTALLSRRRRELEKELAELRHPDPKAVYPEH